MGRVMGICCKLAGVKYDLEQRYPWIIKLERRMCVVETVLNKNNPCFENRDVRRCRRCGVKACCGHRNSGCKDS